MTRLLGVVLIFAILLGMRPWAEAAGPWQAQVVSADSKQPLEGVVVLAWWTRHVRSLGGFSDEYRDSQEVLTDMDGAYAMRTANRAYRTTPLRGLQHHPPYFHDGSAKTLKDVVGHYNDERKLELTSAQQADLVEYLKTL